MIAYLWAIVSLHDLIITCNIVWDYVELNQKIKFIIQIILILILLNLLLRGNRMASIVIKISKKLRLKNLL